jgi:biotin carboxyl carrier protein
VIITLDYHGTPVTVALERLGDNRYQATIDGRVILFGASALAHGGWLLQHEQQQRIAYGVAMGNERMVHVDGQHYALGVVDARAKTRQRARSGGDLTAQMPGQVTDMRVRAGESVSASQVLLVMEAMKMEIRVLAPNAGVVKRVLVQKGQVVERGQLLIEMASE